MTWMKLDRFKLEACIRIFIADLVAVILSIVDWPQAIPPNMKLMIGVLGTSFLLAFPVMPFGIPSIAPTGIVLIFVAFGFATMVLCCVVVSRGLFVAFFALTAWLLSGLFFGDNFDKTYGAATSMIVAVTMLTLNLYPLVEDGINTSLPLPKNWTSDALDGLLPSLCDSSAVNCTASDGSQLLPTSDAFYFLVPPDSSSPFAGQNVSLTMTGETDTGYELHVDAPGGLWIIRLLWGQRGLTNPFAVFSNAMIIACWFFVPNAIAAFLPPFRALRGLLSRRIVPQTLGVLLQHGAAFVDNNKEHDEQATTAMDKKSITHLWYSMNAVSGKAGTIIFEPRLCHKGQYPEYIVPQLSSLLGATTDLVLVSSLPSDNDETKENGNEKERSMSLLQASIQALDSQSKQDKEILEQLLALPSGEVEATNDDSKNGSQELQEEESCTQHGYVRQYCTKVADAALAWLVALEGKQEQTLNFWQRSKKTYIIWFLAPLVILKQLVAVASLALKPKSYALRPMLWSAKLVVGYVALFVMTVYWPAYASYALDPDDFPIGSVFHGWHLAAYSATYRPTVEGTIKKGIQRLIGTCVGGFLGWLAVIVCSGSYDDTAPINPYGLTTWLTVTTAVFAMLSRDPGPASLFGSSQDHGYFGMYAGFVQVLVAVEVYLGLGTKADITTNRIVANVTGIAMSMFIAAVPPITSGSDPVHAREFCSILRDTHKALLDIVGNATEGDSNKPMDLEEFGKTHMVPVSIKRRQALLAHNDANRLALLHILVVDPKLTSTLEDLVLTEALVRRSVESLQSLQSKGSKEWSSVCSAIRLMQSNTSNTGMVETGGKVTDDDSTAVRMAKWTFMIQARLEEHRATLEEIKWTWPVGWTSAA